MVGETDANRSCPQSADRRQWPRGPSDVTEVTLWTGLKDSQRVEVLNESLTGIAVLVEDASKLHVEQEIRLSYKEQRMWAIVKHIRPAEGGRYWLGLEWGCSEDRFEPFAIRFADPD